MTQMTLAKHLGITPSQACALERGRTSIGVKMAGRLAHVLNVHPAEILFPEIQKVEIKHNPLGTQDNLQTEEKDIR